MLRGRLLRRQLPAPNKQEHKSSVASNDNVTIKNDANPADKESADNKRKNDLKKDKISSSLISVSPGKKNSAEKNNEGPFTDSGANSTVTNKPAIINNNSRHNNKKLFIKSVLKHFWNVFCKLAASSS